MDDFVYTCIGKLFIDWQTAVAVVGQKDKENEVLKQLVHQQAEELSDADSDKPSEDRE